MMVTRRELSTILKLVVHLNDTAKPPACPVAVEVNLIDSNGEPLGVIDWSSSAEEYCYFSRKERES